MAGSSEWQYLRVTGNGKKVARFYKENFRKLFLFRYLYLNVRPWPRDYLASMTSVVHPPPVGSQVDRHVFDLGRMAFVSKQVHVQASFVASDPNPWSPICVTKHLIGSGNEGPNSAAIWDRHYGIKISEFTHKDVVNSIAINPVDEQMAVTVGDDMKVRVWKAWIKK